MPQDLRKRTSSQEADETLYWRELLKDECKINNDSLMWLEKECNELIAIFVTMSKKVKKTSKT